MTERNFLVFTDVKYVVPNLIARNFIHKKLAKIEEEGRKALEAASSEKEATDSEGGLHNLPGPLWQDERKRSFSGYPRCWTRNS